MMCCFHILANTACCMYTDLLFPLILYISLSCQLAKICHDLYSGSLSYCFAATVLCYEVTLFEEILAKLELCFCTPYTIPSSSTIYIYNIYRDHGTKHTYTWKDLLLGYNSTTLLLTTYYYPKKQGFDFARCAHLFLYFLCSLHLNTVVAWFVQYLTSFLYYHLKERNAMFWFYVIKHTKSDLFGPFWTPPILLLYLLLL